MARSTSRALLDDEIDRAEAQGVTAESMAHVINMLRSSLMSLSRMRVPAGAAESDDPDDDSTYLALARVRGAVLKNTVDRGHTVAESAEMTGLSESYIRHLLSDGKWPRTVVHGRVRIPSFVFTGNGRELPHIREVALAAKDAGWTVYTLGSFLTRRQDYWESVSDGTAYSWLAEGNDPDWVLELIGPAV